MINSITIQGRLCADPELRKTKSDVSVTSIRIAWSVEGKYPKNLFISATAWGAKAEVIAKNFTKGKEIIVEGSLEIDEWTDREGSKRLAPNINIREFHFCGPKANGEAPTFEGSNSLPAESFPGYVAPGAGFEEIEEATASCRFKGVRA